MPLYPPEFHFNVDELEAAFRQHPKAMILCNPSNPCGKVFTYDELKIIADLAEKYDVYVITDEVYEHIVYAPNKHTYFASLPGMWKRTLSCSSLSKTYSITGWRLGYIIAPPEIIETAKKVHDFLTVGAAAPLQEAAVTGLPTTGDVFQATAIVGPTLGIASRKDQDTKVAAGVHAALQAGWRVNNNLELYVEPSATVYSKKIEQWTQHPAEGELKLSVGAKLHF